MASRWTRAVTCFPLGSVLYEMATGQQAFNGDSTAMLNDAILHRSPVVVTDLNSELPAELQEVIQKCLEKDRNLRYQHAEEIRSALETVQRATQQSHWRRHWKTVHGGSGVDPGSP